MKLSDHRLEITTFKDIKDKLKDFPREMAMIKHGIRSSMLTVP